MEDDDIYSSPPEENSVSSFSQIRKAFEQKQQVPIKVATDGRHANKDNSVPNIKPKVSFKPKLFGDGNKPTLPQKKVTNTIGAKTPPQIPISSKPPVQIPSEKNTPPPVNHKAGSLRRASERESMFPPSGDDNGNTSEISVKENKPHKPVTKPRPDTPNRSENIPVQSSSETLIVQSKHGKFKQRSLPPAGRGPPSKPAKILDDSPRQSVVGVEPEEIYDDVSSPLPTEKDEFPIPPSGKQNMRPVSLIPEMTEEDEISDDDVSPRSPNQIHPMDSDQEEYDDVITGAPAAEEADEIYEDI